MNHFTDEELIIVVKEIINCIKEIGFFEYYDELNLPQNIKLKLDNLKEEESIILFETLDEIVEDVMLDQTEELNSLNMLHENIFNKLKGYK